VQLSLCLPKLCLCTREISTRYPPWRHKWLIVELGISCLNLWAVTAPYKYFSIADMNQPLRPWCLHTPFGWLWSIKNPYMSSKQWLICGLGYLAAFPKYSCAKSKTTHLVWCPGSRESLLLSSSNVSCKQLRHRYTFIKNRVILASSFLSQYTCTSDRRHDNSRTSYCNGRLVVFNSSMQPLLFSSRFYYYSHKVM